MRLISLAFLGVVSTSVLAESADAQLYRIQDITVPAPATPAAAPKPTGRVPSTLSATGVVIHDMRAILGKGFDVLTGEVVADEPCLLSNGNDGGYGADRVGRTEEHFSHDVVTSITSHQESSGQSVSFGVTYKMISASASTGTGSEHYFNSSDAFARVYHSIITKAEYRDGGKWSPRAATLLKEATPTNFLKACSTHYVAAIYWGHVIDETLHFTLRDDKRTAKDSDSLSIGVKDIVNFNYSSNSSSTNASQLATISDIKDSYGTLAVQAPPPAPDPGAPAPGAQPGSGQPTGMTAITALLDYSKFDFPKKVAASNPGDADVLYVEVRPYSERVLPDLARIPTWLDEVFQLMQDKSFLVEQLTTEISDLNYALGLDGPAPAPAPATPGAPPAPPTPHPAMVYDQLYLTPRPDAEQKLTDALAVKKSFKDAIDTCRTLMLGNSGANAATACKTALNAALDATKVKAAALVRKHA